MMSRGRATWWRRLVAAALIAVAAGSAAGQAAGQAGGGTPAPDASQPSAQPSTGGQPAPAHVPSPWKPEELPPWLNDLRRGEILFFGSLPFSLFYTFEVYDLYRFAASGLDPLAAPWPFRAAGDIQYTPAEKGWLLVTGVTLSLGVAVADFLIRQFRARAKAAPAASSEAR